MSDNPFNEAMDEAEEAETDGDTAEGFDAERYFDMLGKGPKEHTIGFAVDEETYRFYKELREDDDVDIDPAQSFRDHLENLAHRHEKTFERAMRKLEIDREL